MSEEREAALLANCAGHSPSVSEQEAEALEALYALDGATIDQVADRLGLSYTAARARLYRLQKRGLVEAER